MSQQKIYFHQIRLPSNLTICENAYNARAAEVVVRHLVISPKDSEYEIKGSDLTKDVEITPPEAVLGCKKEIETLHGNITIKIPPMTSSGKSLRLKDLGLPKKTGGYGNLNAKIKIVLPEKLTQKEIDLYKQLAKA